MSTAPDDNPTLARLDEQIRWYGKAAGNAQRWFKVLRTMALIAGALVPLLAYGDVGKFPVAAMGVLIVIVEGVQQLNQFQANWTSYRSTGEALKREKYLFLAGAGPYRDADDPLGVLAETVEGLVSKENAKWLSTQERAAKSKPGSPTTP